jgi:hypothetical protein
VVRRGIHSCADPEAIATTQTPFIQWEPSGQVAVNAQPPDFTAILPARAMTGLNANALPSEAAS